jgi:hypothetical protein
MNNIKEVIQDFLNKFCEKVLPDESDSHIDLMMDRHVVIEICLRDSKFEEYYVPKENSFFSEDDEMLQEMLIATYGI